MSKRKGREEGERSPSPSEPEDFCEHLKENKTVILELPGFYIVDSNGVVRSKEVTKGKPGSPDRCTVIEPVRYRTIAAAKDICEALGADTHAILCTIAENFAWGE